MAELGDHQRRRGRQKLTDIKAQDGGDIAMSGSATTVRWLLREGLLDELNLLVHPIVVGDGLARLFPPDEPSIPLELAELRDVQDRRAEPQLRARSRTDAPTIAGRALSRGLAAYRGVTDDSAQTCNREAQVIEWVRTKTFSGPVRRP